MGSSFNLDSGMSNTRSEHVDTTKNRTIRDIRKAIDNQFGEKIQTFTVNDYSRSQIRPKPMKRKMIRIPNRWTKSTKTKVSKPLPPKKAQKARFAFGVKAALFLFSGQQAWPVTQRKAKNPKTLPPQSAPRHNHYFANRKGNIIGTNERKECGIKCG